MFPMVKKPYDIYYSSLYCNNAIAYINYVEVVAKCGAAQYSSRAVSEPGADCAFYVCGKATCRMNGNYFKCLAHCKEDGSLWIEPVNLVNGKISVFGPNTETARTGVCAKHGINYSEFTTVDAEMITMAIGHCLSPKAEAAH